MKTVLGHEITWMNQLFYRCLNKQENYGQIKFCFLCNIVMEGGSCVRHSEWWMIDVFLVQLMNNLLFWWWCSNLLGLTNEPVIVFQHHEHGSKRCHSSSWLKTVVICRNQIFIHFLSVTEHSWDMCHHFWKVLFRPWIWYQLKTNTRMTFMHVKMNVCMALGLFFQFMLEQTHNMQRCPFSTRLQLRTCWNWSLHLR